MAENPIGSSVIALYGWRTSMDAFTQAHKLQNPVRVGTSGWSYDDWVGPFYYTNERPKWLDFYAHFFDTVEINSTYYRIPSQKLVDVWIQKGLKHDGFEYSLKFPRFYELDDLSPLATEFESIVAHPLNENDLLGAILIQLTPYVKRIERGYRTGNLDKLDAFLGGLRTQDYTYFVEFRHVSWLDSEREDLDPGTKDVLEQHHVGLCIVDGPSFPTVFSGVTRTTESAYIRLHGRNVEEWFKRHRDDETARSKRYDYVYTEDELAPWRQRILALEKELGGKRRIWVYFNNHPRGNAPHNALMLKRLLGQDLPEQVQEKSQSTAPTTLEKWARRS
ncbi:MAG: DUF72 domain-containing protein [Halobacteriota archaeon]